MGWGSEREGGSSSSRLFLVAGETQRRMRPPLRSLTQWQRCLAFRARGQGGASHHLPTKAQVTQPAPRATLPPTSPNISPSFLPSPHQLTSPQAQLRKLRASHHSLPSSSTATPTLLLHLPPLAPPPIARLPPYSTSLEEKGLLALLPAPLIFSPFSSSPSYISENRTSP